MSEEESSRLQVRLNQQEYGDILGYLDQVSGSARAGRLRHLIRLGYTQVTRGHSLAEALPGKSAAADNVIDLARHSRGNLPVEALPTESFATFDALDFDPANFQFEKNK